MLPDFSLMSVTGLCLFLDLAGGREGRCVGIGTYTLGQEAPGEWALGIMFLVPLPSCQASQSPSQSFKSAVLQS